MRFRANIEHVDSFIKIVQSVEKLQRRCTIQFAEHEMRIICTGDASEGGIQVWSQIKVDSLFTEYRIQSHSNNEITISLPTDGLLVALRSAAAPTSGQSSSNAFATAETHVIMKLAKNKDRKSVLSFEISSTNSMGRTMNVVQQLLVDVARHADIDRLKEPMCPEPDVHILLPPLAKLRTVVDRLRPLANNGISFRANHAGELQLAVTTESARVEIGWTGLTNPPMASQNPDGDDPDAKDPNQMHGVLVSHKCLLKFLSSHVVSTTTIACICENHCMILYVYIGNVADAGGVLTFYIPAQFDDPM
ncbi:cell cycle checkpoint [Lentinus brumalis]|uniref:Checkpoint protein n=1 Tax=Lentinus brumalis TaxID=2498619 RepID=A0A371DEL4_9APHY|nr:cell cycle checkpoint [Polyporus brumalis]